MSTKLILFEDAHLESLRPIARTRPAFAISCGAYRLVDLVDRVTHDTLHCYLRPYLRDVVAADFPNIQHVSAEDAGPALLVNAAMVPSLATIETLQQLAQAGQPGIVRDSTRNGARVAAAFIPAGVTIQFPADIDSFMGLSDGFLDGLNLPEVATEAPTFHYAHDVLRYHLQHMGENLQDRLDRGTYTQTREGVFLAAGAKLGEHVVTDTSAGPIVLEENASVGPHSYLVGPIHLGRGAKVLEHASIKDAVALGHTTKIGGEVEASIIEPYSNKQHHGFLGHAYLGSWINLGAGTCNSDLKNTYGPVNVRYGDEKVSTEMQFVGCFVGDFTKTAINTSIFTGKRIGVCSMLYGFVTDDVPDFCNYAHTFGQVRDLAVELMIKTQQRTFARRGVTQRDCDVELLRILHQQARSETPLSDEPLTL